MHWSGGGSLNLFPVTEGGREGLEVGNNMRRQLFEEPGKMLLGSGGSRNGHGIVHSITK